MASLKEIKGRIASVNNTLKITSAMKMVASAKLHRTRSLAASADAYCKSLEQIASALGTSVSKSQAWGKSSDKREVAVVVAIASDSSLCGSFNSNAIKAMHQKVLSLKSEGYTRVLLYPLGEKMRQAVIKSGYELSESWVRVISEPEYGLSAELADHLMGLFHSDEVQSIHLVHNHLYSMGKQSPIDRQWLPMIFSHSEQSSDNQEYILEPDVESLSEELLPYLLRTEIYNAVIDSAVSEHAARMVAMQTATDNASDLLEELRLIYNKSRQQAITAELLDIRGE